MDAIVDVANATARQIAEDVSEGVNCLYAIAENGERCEPAALSQLRSALVLIRSGVQLETQGMPVDDAAIEKLDRVIESLGGAGDQGASREMARACLLEITKRWAVDAPVAGAK